MLDLIAPSALGHKLQNREAVAAAWLDETEDTRLWLIMQSHTLCAELHAADLYPPIPELVLPCLRSCAHLSKFGGGSILSLEYQKGFCRQLVQAAAVLVLANAYNHLKSIEDVWAVPEADDHLPPKPLVISIDDLQAITRASSSSSSYNINEAYYYHFCVMSSLDVTVSAQECR